MLGQSSGPLESSSALQIRYVGIRNAFGVLTADAFTQNNPPVISSNVSTQVDTQVKGILSGSVAISRPDQGTEPYVGGPGSSAIIAASGGGTASTATASKLPQAFVPLGLFLNSANGNAFENQQGVASGMITYTSGMGTMECALYETKALAAIGALGAGGDLPYIPGVPLITSLNGYLMPSRVWTGAAGANADLVTIALQSAVLNAASSSTTVGILRMPADSTVPHIVLDQRI